MEKIMEIEFFSDYVCPYCLVAKTALQQALARWKGGEDGTAGENCAHDGRESGGKRQAKLIYKPFELTMEPAERVDTYHDAERREHYKILEEPCRRLGLDMKLPPCVVPRPYTRLAFEGWYFAQEYGRGEVYNSEVYEAYFIREEDIGDIGVLCGLAEKAGLDAEAFRQALETGVYSKRLQEANRYAREERKISHVPTIFIDGREVTAEAYTKEAFWELLEKYGGEDGCGGAAADTKRDERTADGAGPVDERTGVEEHVHVCGPDGCRLFP